MRQGERGFTLVETLVALVILAAALVSLQSGLSLSWNGLGQARAQIVATEHARARLAVVGAETPLVAGTTRGTTADGYAWELSIVPAEPQSFAAPTRSGRLAGYWVRVRVEWQHAAGGRTPRSLELTTFRTGPVAP